MAAAPSIEQLYEKHAGELLGYLSKRCSVEAAQDLLQEIFLHVLRRDSLNEVSRPRAWLFGIARHMVARHHHERALPFPQEVVLNEGCDEQCADPRAVLMREAIRTLSPELRETLELRLDEELSYEEIAAVLDIPLGTVRSRLHVAVQRLREALKPIA
ncbi:MAG TPA: sigma-70 family RNA polymerase sigma factor [Chthoniobacteraceae bacterium]|nr:sigma-70 family RNA polymerase sigma factor [Chthoniobacteraceae bacterium]